MIDGKIYFIIGTDAFDYIESWYKANELKNLVKFIVFVREDNLIVPSIIVLKSLVIILNFKHYHTKIFLQQN